VFNEETPIRFFNNNCKPFLDEKDYVFIENCCQLSIKAFKKMYDARMKPIKEWLTTDDAIQLYNKVVQQLYIDNLYTKYCQGTKEHWDMDSMGYYSDKHELDKLILPTYGGQNIEILADFESLPQQMEKGKDYYLMGTIIDVNKNKKLVSLLTLNNGVVEVKFNDVMFIKYNKKIISIDANGKKITKDESWLTKGQMIIVNGARREGCFVVKKAYSPSRFSVALIETVADGGGCCVRYKRNEE
jgi:DNA polymerase-3 subunit alpha